MNRFLMYTAIGTLVSSIYAAEVTTLYVSVDGYDTNNGSASQPLTSVQAALDKASTLTKPVVVVLKDGTYSINKPLILKSQHSGITLKAETAGKAIISGGQKISRWRKISGRLWKADAPEIDVTQLFLNGDRKTRARTPNTGWYIGQAYNPSQIRNLNYKENFNRFRFKDGQFTNIKPNEITNVYVTIFHAWSTSFHALDALDMTQKSALLASPSYFKFPIGKWEVRFFMENYRAALDAPGEWYLDTEDHAVYYMPEDKETISEATTPTVSKLLSFDGTKNDPVTNVTIEGIVFEYCDWNLPRSESACGQVCRTMTANTFSAISGDYLQQSVIRDCVFRHIGADAVWLNNGCLDVLIQKNHFYDIGGSGLKIGPSTDGGGPVVGDEVSQRITIDNNLVHDCGIIFHGGCGIGILNSANNVVSHNEISDLDYTGISVGWGWGNRASSSSNNVVEHNRISYIGRRVLSDMAGIYLPNQQPGTVVRNNIIHDVNSYEYAGNGIYSDAFGCHMRFESNLVYRVSSVGFMRNQGWDNIVRNNIFAFCGQALYWSGLMGTNTPSGFVNTVLENNISYCNGTNMLFVHKSRKINFNTVFPIQWDNNLYWNKPETIKFGTYTFSQWQAAGQDRHSKVADPLFVNPLAGDFTLQPDSPAFAMGFQPIDYSLVGLYGDPSWTELPKTLDHSFIAGESTETSSDFNGM